MNMDPLSIIARYDIAIANRRLLVMQQSRLQARWAVIHAVTIHKQGDGTFTLLLMSPGNLWSL
jgi:hypothetical protein